MSDTLRMNAIRNCDNGHSSLNAHNWVCPWCDLADANKRADEAMAEAREVIAKWIVSKGMTTGHGDNITDLLETAACQMSELANEARAVALADATKACVDLVLLDIGAPPTGMDCAYAIAALTGARK